MPDNTVSETRPFGRKTLIILNVRMVPLSRTRYQRAGMLAGDGTFASGVVGDAGASVRVEPSNEVGGVMNIAYYHASKFGNGAMVAEEFKKIMAARGVTVTVRHIRDADPRNLPAADLYVFSSPGRIGKPKGNALRFLRKVALEPGTRYAILTTQGAPRPDKKTGKLPTQEEQDRWERVIPIMNELLEAKGMRKVAEGAVLVTGIKGPLEEGWQNKVTAFADQIVSTAGIQPG
jgi:hypothetical protein